MKLCKGMALLTGLALALATPALAQVEKAALQTPGIACGTCALMAELGLKRLPGVDEVTISKSRELVLITYKPGGTFDPDGIREVLEPLGVGIARMQISARGRAQEQGRKQLFIAGRNKFAVATAAKAPPIPSGTLVLIEAVVTQGLDPMELTAMTVKPLAK